MKTKKSPKKNDCGASLLGRLIEDLKQRIDFLESHTLYCFEETEIKKIKAFQKKHIRCERGAIGGATTIMFSPTSLGVIVKVKCHCGKEEDVTDFSVW